MQTDASNVVQHRRDGQVCRRRNGSSERGEVRFDIGVAVPGIFRELMLQFWR